MDVKDVHINSQTPSVSTQAQDAATSPTAGLEPSTLLKTNDTIAVSDQLLLRNQHADTSARNESLVDQNRSLSTLNITDDQASKITGLLRSAAGIANQVAAASPGQVDKLQQELNDILSEIQTTGSSLRAATTSATLDSSVKGSVTEALITIAPEPPSQPPKLVLVDKAGVLATQHAVAKAQAQFAALRESIAKASQSIQAVTQTLRATTTDSASLVNSPEEAFKLTNTVVKGALNDPDTAVQAGSLTDARITL